MYACKFSDLFSSQLCTWLVQVIFLCSFTLIFLLHMLHSVKFSLSIHHIFHQLACWVITANKRFSGDFCTICSVCFIEYTQSFCLYVHPFGCSFLVCSLLLLFPSFARRGKKHPERWGCHEGSPGQAVQRFSARKLCRRHRGRAQVGKNAAFMIFKHHCFDEVWRQRGCMVPSQVLALN